MQQGQAKALTTTGQQFFLLIGVARNSSSTKDVLLKGYWIAFIQSLILFSIIPVCKASLFLSLPR